MYFFWKLNFFEQKNEIKILDLSNLLEKKTEGSEKENLTKTHLIVALFFLLFQRDFFFFHLRW